MYRKMGFIGKKRGVTLASYALLFGVISIVAIFAVSNVGEQVKFLFNKVGNDMTAVFGPPPPPPDVTAPVIAAGQNLSVVDNAVEGAAVGVVTATDNRGVVAFAITAGDLGGFFAIDASGGITVTAVGEAGLDFETTASYTLTISADDAAGNNGSGDVDIAVIKFIPSGPVLAWGYNMFGQLGNNDTDASQSPVLGSSPPSGGGNWVDLDVGGAHSCGIQSGTNLGFCWGNPADGRLGNGVTSGTFLTPVAIDTTLMTGGSQWKDISSGKLYTCGIQRGTNDAFCWGDSNFGGATLGDGGFVDASTPQAVTPPTTGTNDWASIEAGSLHTCAIQMVTDDIFCWGSNFNGQLGIGTTAFAKLDPERVADPATGGNNWQMMASGEKHSCAIQVGTDRIYCWGSSINQGTIGNSNSTNDYNAPTPITPPSLGLNEWVHVAAGQDHSCAIQSGTNEAYCWGRNAQGQLGTGTAGSLRSSPQRVAALPSTSFGAWSSIEGGDEFTCALEVGTRAAYCWGIDSNGASGNGGAGDTAASAPTIVVDGHQYLSLTVSSRGTHVMGMGN